eukprot:scaffold7995_cov173-Amphora_coffeaeformis.AAC.9
MLSVFWKQEKTDRRVTTTMNNNKKGISSAIYDIVAIQHRHTRPCSRFTLLPYLRYRHTATMRLHQALCLFSLALTSSDAFSPTPSNRNVPPKSSPPTAATTSLSTPQPQRPASVIVLHYDNTGDNVETILPETSFGAEAVPEAQRPVNEYLDISRQPLFGWPATGLPGFLVRLGITYAAVFAIICYPIAGATYTQDGFLLQKIAASNVGAVSLLGVLMLRIYSGWGYLKTRLTSKVIEYEETGWYDGDVELKTEAEMKRDRFLYKDKVQPVVELVKTTSLGMGALWVASILAFNAASQVKPMFDQYDVNMLEKLSYDEKLANTAAQSSGGKPAYCDSRYYRAIANGGQGCD